jgi:peptidoglycan hydrolase-like protein with peptidoglycan-binding domain
MTPRQARVALGAFLLLAAGVTGNALFLQGAIPPKSAVRKAAAAPGPGKPAPRSVGAATERPTIASLLKPEHADAGIEAPPDEADIETVRSIQRELRRRGYGPFIADGIMRPAARAAVMAFEHEHGLPLTGEATQALLKRLVFGASGAGTGTVGALEVRSRHAEALVKDVQRLLTARGYRPGAIDGRLGAETVAAIRVFETDEGLTPRGRISAEVLTRLQDGPAGAKRHKKR